MDMILDTELKDFCTWYSNHFNKRVSTESVILTCMCGYFHTYTRVATMILKRCKALKYVEVEKGVVTIL